MPLPLPLQEAQLPAPAAQPTTPAPAGPATTPAPRNENGLFIGVPRNAQERAALRAQREELSDQLQSAAGRREALVKDLDGATGVAREGIEARIQLLDQRILQIEADIASTGKLIVGNPTGASQPASNPDGSPFMNVDVTGIVAILSVFVLGPLAVTYARNMWRKGSAPVVDDKLARENADRLARLESAVDSIAVEVERISEGQRFVTKLLAESERGEKLRIEQPRN